jgi:hypothetical protein
MGLPLQNSIPAAMLFYTAFFAIAALATPITFPSPQINTPQTNTPQLNLPKYCTLPEAGGSYQTATGAQVNISQAIANQAIENFALLGTVSIQIFRYNCLIASSPLSPITGNMLQNIFSATKGVISMITGIAKDQGLLQLDDPIGLYLPDEPGWGDSTHRNITIRQLLNENAGMETGVVAEGLTVLADQSLPQESLAQSIIHTPGTFFEYSQRVPDLLAYVVSRAVGQDFQTFAQTYLFDPIGIPKDSYVWFRDRSGNTYGYAYLYISPLNFARLGLLMQNNGVWNGRRVISSSYVSAVSEPSPTNPCYGLLFWTNALPNCIGPDGYRFKRSYCPSTPLDTFAMSGAPQQKNFMIPSLNMTVSWAAVLDPILPQADAWYQFFATLMPGVEGIVPVPIGPWEDESLSNSQGNTNAFSPTVFMTDLMPSPNCNIIFCGGTIPFVGLLGNLGSITSWATYSVRAMLGI